MEIHGQYDKKFESIVDSFEKKGIVSSPNAMGRREILINEYE